MRFVNPDFDFFDKIGKSRMGIRIFQGEKPEFSDTAKGPLDAKKQGAAT